MFLVKIVHCPFQNAIIFAVIILYFVVVKGKDTTEELTPAPTVEADVAQ